MPSTSPLSIHFFFSHLYLAFPGNLSTSRPSSFPPRYWVGRVYTRHHNISAAFIYHRSQARFLDRGQHRASEAKDCRTSKERRDIRYRRLPPNPFNLPIFQPFQPFNLPTFTFARGKPKKCLEDDYDSWGNNLCSRSNGECQPCHEPIRNRGSVSVKIIQGGNQMEIHN